MKKLSKPQIRLLRYVAKGPFTIDIVRRPGSGFNSSTLRSLLAHGLIVFPGAATGYRITPAGSAALEQR